MASGICITKIASLDVEFDVISIAASLSALFKHVESIDESTDETIRDKVLTFIRDKVPIVI